MSKIDIPPVWEQAVAYVASKVPQRVLLLGATDTGKSTLALYLAKYLLSKGLSVALLDADVGQKDVGPPATIGLIHLKSVLSHLSPLLAAEALYFVGSVTPVGHMLPLIVGTKRLLERSQAQVTIVNTTGLVKGPGVALKSFQIENIQPELILALQRQGELEPILASYKYLETLRLPVPAKVSPKSPLIRRARRQEAFKRHFQGAKSISLDGERLILQRVPRQGLRVGLLCAVANKQGETLALAVIQGLEEGGQKLKIFTPAPEEDIAVLICGSMGLTPLGEERHFCSRYIRTRSFPSRPCRNRRVSLPRGQRFPPVRSRKYKQRPRFPKSRFGPTDHTVHETEG